MLYVGFAETDITPKLGSQSPGGMQARRLNEVHDPLKAVAMVIKSEAATVALVGIDSIFISEETTARAREAITAATKIPGSHVLIGASHTHGGGPVATCFESEADPEYVELVATRVAEAVTSAYHSLHPAELGDGLGHEPSISFNRRFLMRDGTPGHPSRQGKPRHRQAGRSDRPRRRRARRPRAGRRTARALCQLRLPSHRHGRKWIHGRLCVPLRESAAQALQEPAACRSASCWVRPAT